LSCCLYSGCGADGTAAGDARTGRKPWASVVGAFLVEPLGPSRCRVVSRYRCASSSDLQMRVSLGPTLIEPVGFAMDRRMLLGIKERAERQPSV